jgi:3-dehydroquinate dehydratase
MTNILQLSLASFLTVISSVTPSATAIVSDNKPLLAALSPANIIELKADEMDVNVKLAKSIAFCESTDRQFTKDGEVLRGKKNPKDVGLFQINEDYHLEKAKALGYDIYTTEGNIGYAVWLLKNEGARHWNASRKCWG